MEYKHEIAFRTFKEYCKHKRGSTFPKCYKTMKAGVRTEWCEKRNCPLFKRLTKVVSVNDYYRGNIL